MTDNSASLDALSSAIDQTAQAIAAVRDDQLDDPTPCADWDVGQLVTHLAVGAGHLLEQAQGGTPDWAAAPDRVEDPAAMFRTSGAALLAHQRDEDANADWQLAELAVHTWDLVTATDQTTRLDPVVAERGHAFMSNTLKPEMRAGMFGPEQPAPDDADPYQRIAAFAGREVS